MVEYLPDMHEVRYQKRKKKNKPLLGPYSSGVELFVIKAKNQEIFFSFLRC
jgi:hypothetical protein